MKRLLFLEGLVLFYTFGMFAQYPNATLRQIQEVPRDSLLLADTLQSSVPARWRLQTSPLMGDTVTVTALCLVPAKVLTFTAGGYTMLLYDTAAVSEWGTIFVRVNAPGDTAQIILDGFLAPSAGDIIKMTGIVSEFPITSMNSVTQFQPLAGKPIAIVGSAPIPAPIRKNVGHFYQGLFPGGKVRYSTGESFEGVIVELTNLTLDAKVNTGRGTFSMVDVNGNQITMYDASRYFTLGHGGTTPFPADSVWSVKYPALGVGTRVDTIRGFITTVSGSENPRGYRIAPIYRRDIVFGVVPPSISSHRRNPVVVPPDSAARISVVVNKQQGGSGIATVSILYSVNNGAWTSLPLTLSDTTYKAAIPQQPQNSFVRYFIKAVDSLGISVILANSAVGAFAGDTSKGFFFYTVLNRPVTIQDIQYTPFVNGRGAYIGAVVTVPGIVTADTASIGISPLNVAGTNAWFIQSGNQPWSGLWLTGTDTMLVRLRNGDSISVTGTVQEQFDVTRINDTTKGSAVIRASGKPLPAPVVLTTGAFGPNVGNGFASAEPYEGMLVRFNNVTINDVNPIFSDPTEFSVDDGSGPVLVRRDGRHNYSNVQADTATSKTILKLSDRITSLTGVIHYSFNRYKIVPRTNADFGTITSVDIRQGYAIPERYALEQNYPNPFNPSTLIEYTLPSTGLVTLKVYDILGQEVRTLVNELQTPGRYTVRFDGASLATGVYFYRLQAGAFNRVKKMMMLK